MNGDGYPRRGTWPHQGHCPSWPHSTWEVPGAPTQKLIHGSNSIFCLPLFCDVRLLYTLATPFSVLFHVYLIRPFGPAPSLSHSLCLLHYCHILNFYHCCHGSSLTCHDSCLVSCATI